jgi:hypothetical protein
MPWSTYLKSAKYEGYSISSEFITKILGDAGTSKGSQETSGRTCPTRLLRRGRGPVYQDTHDPRMPAGHK